MRGKGKRIKKEKKWIFLIYINYKIIINGGHSEDKKNILQQMPDPYCAQGDSVQEGKGKQGCPRKKTLRQEAIRLRWTNQTHFQKESQNNKENHS
jgi:hypothetical protein